MNASSSRSSSSPSWPALWFVPLLAVLVLASTALVGGCCGRSPDLLSIWLMPEGSFDDPESRRCDDWDVIVWGGTTEVAAGTSVLVAYQDDDDPEVRKPEVLQFYGASGTEVVPPTEFSSVHTCHTGCPSPRRLYRLDLTPGTYTMVHRKRHGTNKPVHTPGAVNEDPWEAYEDEPALVTTLVITNP